MRVECIRLEKLFMESPLAYVPTWFLTCSPLLWGVAPICATMLSHMCDLRTFSCANSQTVSFGFWHFGRNGAVDVVIRIHNPSKPLSGLVAINCFGNRSFRDFYMKKETVKSQNWNQNWNHIQSKEKKPSKNQKIRFLFYREGISLRIFFLNSS